MQQPADLVDCRRMAEDGQPERGFGHEHVAGLDAEGRASGIGAALVIARDDDAGAGMLQHHLRRAENMAGGDQAQADIADLQGFVVFQRLRSGLHLGAIAYAHDRQRRRSRERACVAGARMVGMAVRDHRALDRLGRVDEKPAGLDKSPCGSGRIQFTGGHAFGTLPVNVRARSLILRQAQDEDFKEDLC